MSASAMPRTSAANIALAIKRGGKLMKTEFEVSFQKNDVYQARLVLAENKDVAERYFRNIEPQAIVIGISENQCGHKPGMPIEEVPNEWRG